MSSISTRAPRSSRRSRFARGATPVLVAALTLGGVCGLVGQRGAWAAPAGPRAAGPPGASGPSGTTAVACLDARLRPADDCPAVTAEASVRMVDEDLVVMIENVGTSSWPGGPLAVELPVPRAEVDEAEGRDDETGAAGTPEWTTRMGTVVSRCVFDPVERIRPGGRLTCRLHRLGLPDGDHELWLTGFVGGLPDVTDSIGDDPPALGVVAAATTRSIRVRIDGDRAVVLDPRSGSGGAASDGARGTDEPADRTLPVVVGLGAATLAVGFIGWRRRRRPD